MKEALWGTLIVILGLFGVVVVNVFQNVTMDNDKIYYLIKESTEAAAFDALDLTYYRISGDLKIVEDKFVENLTRRFAQNVTIGDYTIVIQDISQIPPKISLKIKSGVTSLNGEKFDISNRVDAIVETKYTLDEVLEFLDITEEEWNKTINKVKIEKDPDTNQNTCKTVIDDSNELECIPGDLKFLGFGDMANANYPLKTSVCHTAVLNETRDRLVNYKVCECGKWGEKITEAVTSKKVKKNGNEWIYTWNFVKTGEIRTISESMTSRVRIVACLEDIDIMVPNDINTIKLETAQEKASEQGKDYYEPSSLNSAYMKCPSGGIKIQVGMKFVMHPLYDPLNVEDREVEWSSDDNSIVGVYNNYPSSTCTLNSDATNCLYKANIYAKKTGTTTVRVSGNGKTASCKVEVYEVDNLRCKDQTITVGQQVDKKALYDPENATVDIIWSISEAASKYVKLVDKKEGIIKGIKVANVNGITLNLTDRISGKSGSCTIKVKSASSSGSTSGGSGTCTQTGTCHCAPILQDADNVLGTCSGNKCTCPGGWQATKNTCSCS